MPAVTFNPSDKVAPNGEPRGISSAIFPAWFVCEEVDVVGTGPAGFRRRRLVRWRDLDATGRKRFNFDDGRKSEVTPIAHKQELLLRGAVILQECENGSPQFECCLFLYNRQ